MSYAPLVPSSSMIIGATPAPTVAPALTDGEAKAFFHQRSG